MKTVYKILGLLICIAVLTSCASGTSTSRRADATTETIPQETPLENYDVSETGSYGYDQYGQPRPGGPVRGGPQTTITERLIYFDFDSTEIRPEYRPVVEAHARYLRENPSSAVVLEGHTDERGTREYNIGLGERRAEAVRRLMGAYGVALGQVSTVSYGEERPAVAGQDEASYAQNRRVEIVYLR